MMAERSFFSLFFLMQCERQADCKVIAPFRRRRKDPILLVVSCAFFRLCTTVASLVGSSRLLFALASHIADKLPTFCCSSWTMFGFACSLLIRFCFTTSESENSVFSRSMADCSLARLSCSSAFSDDIILLIQMITHPFSMESTSSQSGRGFCWHLRSLCGESGHA